ncbi:MAG: IS630 family transposase, partial [Chloroflexota bacterium]|nr:IS630 family transposase [Chloroflexota bacterium]
LPAYTPELQPAERLWPLIREGVANQSFADLDALQQRLVDRCLTVSTTPHIVRALTNFHWLPQQ